MNIKLKKILAELSMIGIPWAILLKLQLVVFNRMTGDNTFIGFFLFLLVVFLFMINFIGFPALIICLKREFLIRLGYKIAKVLDFIMEKIAMVWNWTQDR